MISRIFLALATSLVLTTHCFAAQSTLSSELVESGLAGKKVVLFEPDIELNKVLGSGRGETMAEWSENGLAHSKKWIAEFFADSGAELVPDTLNFEEGGDRFRQVVALHRVVGFSILNNQLVPIPTKKKNFSWSIGNGAEEIAAASGADYGLFTFYRRGYASGGRVATAVVLAVAFGAVIQSSYQVGFTSLVDLKTGEIVWFHNFNSGPGDLRDAEDSQYTVAKLLEDFPGLDLPEAKNNDVIGATAD